MNVGIIAMAVRRPFRSTQGRELVHRYSLKLFANSRIAVIGVIRALQHSSDLKTNSLLVLLTLLNGD